MKKVAVITSRFPFPLDKGDKLRIFHHLKELSRRFEVYLISLHEKPLNEEAIEAVRPFCTAIHTYQLSTNQRKFNALKATFSGLPIQVGYFYDKAIHSRIDFLLQQIQPDHIHCHLVRMSPYLSHRQSSSMSIDFMDSMQLNDMAGQHLSTWPLTLFRRIERRRIRTFEKDSHKYFDAHFIISDRDRLHLDTDIQRDIQILSNGVVQEEPSAINLSANREYDICFCGNLGYGPNKKAVTFILNELIDQLPDLKIVVAGAEAPDSMIQLAKEKQVTLLSPVVDMKDIYRSARIQIAPIWDGSGQQNKILEAMALGVPCVTTSFVNESIGAEETKEILLAESPEAFIHSINVLLSQPEILDSIRKNGIGFIKRNFDWGVNSNVLLESIDKLDKV